MAPRVMRSNNRKQPARSNVLEGVRFSQVISTYGPGALMNLPGGETFVVGGIDDWGRGERISEVRLTARLKVRALRTPPPKEETRGIPCLKFPLWGRCPKCSRLLHDRDLCPVCNEKTVPSRFIRICRRGHLDEFDYNYWVHRNNKVGCDGQLFLEDQGKSNSISDLIVRCEKCKSRQSLGRALQEAGPCGGRRPWLGGNSFEECGEKMKGSLRGASNVYFAATASALSIPPFSHPVYRLMEGYVDALGRSSEGLKRALLAEKIEQGELPVWATVDLCLKALDRLTSNAAEPLEDLRLEEYGALTSPAEDSGIGPPAPDFQIRMTEVPYGFGENIAKVVLVERLREVRALIGFTRIEARDEQEELATEVARISRAEPTWLPAIETRGEGIFIELDMDAVSAWEARASVRKKVRILDDAYGDWREERKLERGQPIAGRQILLHSLAHLLIRQLSLYCGYSMASLRERIYSSSEMCGFLVYTATVDSEGSLGGLLRMGEPKRLAVLLRRLLEEARWCSADPLCSEHEPDASGQLNGAACHSCLLLPETSCEGGNKLLDRTLVIDDVGDSGFFND